MTSFKYIPGHESKMIKDWMLCFAPTLSPQCGEQALKTESTLVKVLRS